MPVQRAKSAKFDQPKKKTRTPIAWLNGFVPLLTVWGAALAGLTIAVLPASAIANIANLTPLNELSRLALGLLAALLGGLIAFAIARAIRNAVSTPAPKANLMEAAQDDAQDVELSEDRSSDRPTTPIDFEELAGVLEELEEAPTDAVRSQPFEETTVEGISVEPPEELLEEPLELGEIGEMLEAFETPEAPAPTDISEPQADPAPELPPPPPPPLPEDAPDFLKGSAVDGLRRMPTADLSLMQMVERFATALHAHQAVHGAGAQPRRDAALAEGLRALSMFSHSESDPQPAGLTPGGFANRAPALEVCNITQQSRQSGEPHAIALKLENT
ncbi:MAG: hypothetical protein AAGL68_09620 [Pseudomonadota bacterium]